MIFRDAKAVKGKWTGEFVAPDAYAGTFVTDDGRRFEGHAHWLSERMRDIHTSSGDVLKQVAISMTPHWEFTGTFLRRDGRGATAPFNPVPPEERDDGEPPPEDAEV